MQLLQSMIIYIYMYVVVLILQCNLQKLIRKQLKRMLTEGILLMPAFTTSIYNNIYIAVFGLNVMLLQLHILSTHTHMLRYYAFSMANKHIFSMPTLGKHVFHCRISIYGQTQYVYVLNMKKTMYTKRKNYKISSTEDK